MLLRAHQGDAEARDTLVRENMGLVRFALRRFRDRRADYEDLIQWGCVGLLKAIDRFDPRFDVRFSTYAVPMILGEARRALRDAGTLHVARSIRENAARLERWREEVVRLRGREPTLEEIRAGTGLTAEEIVLAAGASRQVRSLDEPVDEDGARLMDTIGEDTMNRVDAKLTISKMIRDLPQEDRALIVNRYFRSHTQTRIALEMGISQAQVSRMEKRILARMRSEAGESDFGEYQ